jgi:hypothetical protein
MSSTINRTTCFSIAKGETDKYIPNYFDVPIESATSVDLDDICHVIKSDINTKKYKKRLNMYTLREKMEREIEKGMPSTLYEFDYWTASDRNIDVNKEFNSLLTVLHYQHSYVCKLVMNNLHKIKREIEKERELNDYKISYDYSYIVNLMWNHRYSYAVKLFRSRIGISDTQKYI